MSRLKDLGDTACPEGKGGYGIDFKPGESKLSELRRKLRTGELNWKETQEALKELVEDA